jgi:hypothetical protein
MLLLLLLRLLLLMLGSGHLLLLLIRTNDSRRPFARHRHRRFRTALHGRQHLLNGFLTDL